MSDIRIRIGASVDSDLGNIFRPIRDEARRTRKQISDDQKSFDKAMYKASLAEARDHHKALTQLNRDAFKAKVQSERDAARQTTSIRMEAAKRNHAIEIENIKKSAAAEREAARNASREKIEGMRLADREARRLSMTGGRGGDGGLIGYLGGRQVVSGAGRDFRRMMGAGAHVVGQVGRGLGVDFDISSMVRRNVERDKLARDIVNSAYQPGAEGPAGKRVPHGDLVSQAEQVGKDARIDPTAALQGVQKFVEVSGDLATARDTMGSLAMLSQATGSELNHVAEAAGNVSVQLGDVPDKAGKVMTVMRAVAGQGKLGAVELRDMAKQMAALAANASNFAGKPEDTIAMMGVLAQEARQHGSAKSASEAAFSVSSLVQTFSKNPRVAAMKAAGIKVFNEKGQINDIQGIITQMLVKTGGDRIKIGDMVKDARARRAVMGFENIFRNTSVDPRKGESKGDFKIREMTAKVAAVTQEFERLKRIAMSEGEIRESAILAMESPAAKAQAFQNELDKTTKEIQARLLPALEKMAPDIIRVAGAFGKMVEFATNNPMEAIFGALALSVAKAGVGEIIARAVGTSLTGGAGSLAGLANGAGGASGALGLGAFAAQVGIATLTIASLGLAADQAQKLWSEMNPDISHPPGQSEEDIKRLANMSPAERDAERAANMNVDALERAGHTTGKRGTFGPPTASVAQMTDQRELLTSSQLQANILGSILKAQLTTVEEIRAFSGENKRGGDGFNGADPPTLSDTGVTNAIMSSVN